jgi:uncharacterized protein (DUF952 family)
MFRAFFSALCLTLTAETPQFLYKITSPQNWTQSQTAGYVLPNSIDTNYIHLATENQVPYVIKKFWSNQNYVLLKLDPKKFEGKLIYELNPGGTQKFYHLYNGKIPLTAVISATPHKA